MTVLFSPGSTTPTIDGITFSGPAFQAAEKICNPLGNPGTAPRPVTEQQKRDMLGFANCMRHHGFSQWADPTVPPGRGIMAGDEPYAQNTREKNLSCPRHLLARTSGREAACSRAVTWLLLLAGERPKEEPLGRGRLGDRAALSDGALRCQAIAFASNTTGTRSSAPQ